MASATSHLLLPDKDKSRSLSVSVKNELCDQDKKYIQLCSDIITSLDGMLLDELERRMEVVHGRAKAKLQNDYKEAKSVLEIKPCKE